VLHSKRPRMSAEEATSFSGFSVANATTVTAALQCGCAPYVDVFTLPRWNAQGFKVIKGEHSIRIPVVAERAEEDDEGNTITRKVRWMSGVFCRHQVEPFNGSSTNGKVNPQEHPREALRQVLSRKETP